MDKSLLPPSRPVMRMPGQIATKEQIELQRLAERRAVEPDLNEYLKDGAPIYRPEAVMKGLMLDNGAQSELRRILEQTDSELALRQSVYAFYKSRDLDPAVGRVLLHRSVNYYRNSLTKALVLSVESDKLEKAVARGGSYHRRIPKQGGGYRYIYDEDTYRKAKDAHISGDEATQGYLRSSVEKCLSKGPCGAEAFKSLVEKHGSKAVANVLRESVKKGTVVYKAGKFSKPSEGDNAKATRGRGRSPQSKRSRRKAASGWDKRRDGAHERPSDSA
jgi:hypothetical protein